jgi:hypothetical protein
MYQNDNELPIEHVASSEAAEVFDFSLTFVAARFSAASAGRDLATTTITDALHDPANTRRSD